MKLLFRILAPLVIVGAAVWVAVTLIRNRPEPRTFQAPPQVTRVEATRLKPTSYQVFLDTQGTVRPRISSALIAEVSGRIIEVSPNFRAGGFFSEGEVLLRLDPIDYETRKVVAQSAVAEAERALREEEVRGQQAIENWRRLGKTGEPSDLVARMPQLAEAKARLRAVEAELVQAERDLERTRVTAPYDGRIIEQDVDVGQFVSSNTQLARAFATDVMEVRLPLTNRQLSFLELPSGRGWPEDLRETGAEVLVTGRIGSSEGNWKGRVVRVDSLIDESSRQLFVVAEIEDPYNIAGGEDAPELKIGLFVDAHVKGELLENVFVLPREAVRVGGEVIVIEADNRIRRQAVEAIWSEDDTVVIPAEGAGLEPGEVVCLTPLAYPANGALVQPTIDGVTPEIEQPGRPGWSGGGPKGKKKKGGAKGETRVGGQPPAPGEGNKVGEAPAEEEGATRPQRS